MRNVTIHPLVAQLCGGLDRVEAILVAGSEYRCTLCRAFGRLGDEPVNMNADRHPGGLTRATYTHARCGAPTVAVTDIPLARPTDGLTDVTGLAMVVGTPFGQWPALLVERLLISMELVPPASDEVDQFLAVMGEWGMSPTASLFGPPPASPGWRVQLPTAGDGGSIRYTPAGADGVLMAPLTDIGFPPLWYQTVLGRGGVCAVYGLSRVALRTVAALPGRQIADLLDAAALDGRVMAATAEVTMGPAPTTTPPPGSTT